MVCLGEKIDTYGNGKQLLFCWITAHMPTKCCSNLHWLPLLPRGSENGENAYGKKGALLTETSKPHDCCAFCLYSCSWNGVRIKKCSVNSCMVPHQLIPFQRLMLFPLLANTPLAKESSTDPQMMRLLHKIKSLFHQCLKKCHVKHYLHTMKVLASDRIG